MKTQRVTCHVCSLKESNLGQASWQEHLLIPTEVGRQIRCQVRATHYKGNGTSHEHKHVEQLQIHGTAYSGSHQALGLQQHCHTCKSDNFEEVSISLGTITNTAYRSEITARQKNSDCLTYSS